MAFEIELHSVTPRVDIILSGRVTAVDLVTLAREIVAQPRWAYDRHHCVTVRPDCELPQMRDIAWRPVEVSPTARHSSAKPKSAWVTPDGRPRAALAVIERLLGRSGLAEVQCFALYDEAVSWLDQELQVAD
ncbi:hypothetical protein [Maricaulis sp.]|uniref:hypothetical protein n=1 Tax=Maricaulis sp. TaxID=1486257 RepID=UPI00261FC6EC|nr:hypothetical protein [Maricaulis sp.]